MRQPLFALLLCVLSIWTQVSVLVHAVDHESHEHTVFCDSLLSAKHQSWAGAPDLSDFGLPVFFQFVLKITLPEQRYAPFFHATPFKRGPPAVLFV